MPSKFVDMDIFTWKQIMEPFENNLFQFVIHIIFVTNKMWSFYILKWCCDEKIDIYVLNNYMWKRHALEK